MLCEHARTWHGGGMKLFVQHALCVLIELPGLLRAPLLFQEQQQAAEHVFVGGLVDQEQVEHSFCLFRPVSFKIEVGEPVQAAMMGGVDHLSTRLCPAAVEFVLEKLPGD